MEQVKTLIRISPLLLLSMKLSAPGKKVIFCQKVEAEVEANEFDFCAPIAICQLNDVSNSDLDILLRRFINTI